MLPLLEATDVPFEGELKVGGKTLASAIKAFAGAGRKPLLWIGELVEADTVSEDDVGERTLSSSSPVSSISVRC